MASKQCSHGECGKEIGFFERSYECAGCGRGFCDDCCANDSYLRHLKGRNPRIDKAIEASGYLCVDCLGATPEWSDAWSKNIVGRVCAHDPCDNRLDAVTTVKGACVACGKLFCSSHRKSKGYVAIQELRRIQRFPDADDICLACTPRDQRAKGFMHESAKPVIEDLEEVSARVLERARVEANEIVRAAEEATQRRLAQAREEMESAARHAEDVIDRRLEQARVVLAETSQDVQARIDAALLTVRATTFDLSEDIRAKIDATLGAARQHLTDAEGSLRTLAADVEQKAKKGYVLLGLRVALAAASVFVLTAALPRLQTAARAPTMEVLDFVWSSLMLVMSSAYLTIEFVRPGFADRASRPYATALTLTALVVTWYLLAAPAM